MMTLETQDMHFIVFPITMGDVERFECAVITVVCALTTMTNVFHVNGCGCK